MADSSAENLRSPESKENEPEKISELRKKCSELVEYRETPGPDRLTQKQFSSKKDVDENRRWLQSADAQDPKKLQAFIDQYLKSVEYDRKQTKAYFEKIEEAVKKGLLSPRSVDKYKDWILGEAAAKKAEYIAKSDLDDPARAKMKSDFNELNKYFPDAALRKNFLAADLQARQRMVADLKEKKKTIESVAVLPTVVREFLKHSCANATVEACKKAVAEAQKKHEALKKRFLKLPPLVQAGSREKFKAMMLDAREKWLNDAEKQVSSLAAQYRGKIKKMQRTDSSGLSLFSTRPEADPGSSAHLYMDWFCNKLTLEGMQAAARQSDLDGTKREKVRGEMAKVLQKLPSRDRQSAIKEFNAADLSAREKLLADREAQLNESTTAEGKGIFGRALKRIFGSGADTDAKKKMETFAVVSEIALRRRRFRISHHTADAQTQKAVEDDSFQTAEKSAKLKQQAFLADLKEKNGGVRVKLQTLEAHKDSRDRLRRELRPDVENVHAQLAGDIVLRTNEGAEVKDEENFRRNQLRRELDEVQNAVAPLVRQEMKKEGQEMTDEQIAQALKNADWEAQRKEVLKKTI